MIKVGSAFALTECGYTDIGLQHWMLADSGAFDRIGRELADAHYSRRKVGAPQFVPPGQRFVLIGRAHRNVWAWWRPHPSAGITPMNGLDGWTCTIFRRTEGPRASDLVLDAESAIGALGHNCGPHGLLTYIWDAKTRGSHKGCCYKHAGWHRAGNCNECASVSDRSSDGRKTLLHKPFALAGVKP